MRPALPLRRVSPFVSAALPAFAWPACSRSPAWSAPSSAAAASPPPASSGCAPPAASIPPLEFQKQKAKEEEGGGVVAQSELRIQSILMPLCTLTFQGLRGGLLDGMVDLVLIRQLGSGGLVLQLLQLHTLLQSPQLEHQVDLLVALLLHHQKLVMPECS